ncbi:MAG: hypothetical protein DCC67_01615 [Planctomycetota bacterium]|nr:MAG: hypothetical protein DCC67_01615 [Planctomycetota bacterium]
MEPLLDSNSVHAEIDKLLLSGQAETAHEAEEIWLDSHLPDLTRLAMELDEDSFRKHEAVKLLLSHGSRPFEDGLP